MPRDDSLSFHILVVKFPLSLPQLALVPQNFVSKCLSGLDVPGFVTDLIHTIYECSVHESQCLGHGLDFTLYGTSA